MCVSEKRATLSKKSPSYVNNLEREVGWDGGGSEEDRDRFRINERIGKESWKEKAKDKPKGERKKGKEEEKER